LSCQVHTVHQYGRRSNPNSSQSAPSNPLIYLLQGASSRELLLEACRRNNTDLLSTVLSDFKSTDELANFLNTATDALGCGALHIGAQYGAYEVLDMLLDQEGVEIDGVEKREGDTCLHKAVRYVNSLTKDEWEEGQAIVDILIDAGCDPRCVVQAPIELVTGTDKTVQDTQQGQAAPYRPH
jgi:ankyrin repeat protein